MRDPSLLQRRDDELGLRRRHDPVVGALEHEHRRRDAVREVDRAACLVEIGALGVGTDEGVLVLQLELVRLAAAELLEIGDAEVRRPGGEDVGEGERADHGVAAGAPPGDDEPVGIGLVLLDEVVRRVDAVLEVDDAPLAVQPLAVRAPVPRRAAVVDVDDGEAATRPELGAEAEDRRRAPCRPAVALDDQRRTLSVRCLEVRVRGRVEERVRGEAALGRELDAPWNREALRGQGDLGARAERLRLRDATSTRTTALGDVVDPATMTARIPSAQREPESESSPRSSSSSSPVSGSRTAKCVKPPVSYAQTIRPSPRNANERDPKDQAG